MLQLFALPRYVHALLELPRVAVSCWLLLAVARKVLYLDEATTSHRPAEYVRLFGS
jgi:hypothetical protein